LIEGEDHLRKEFDKVAGEGRYDEIFASEKNPVTGEWVDKVGDKEKINLLNEIHKEKFPDRNNEVRKQAIKIIKEGRYDI
jgi:hypothetical protein